MNRRDYRSADNECVYFPPKLSETETWRDQDERRYELDRDAAESVLGELSRRLPVVTYKNTPPTTLVATLYYDSPEGYYLQRAKAGGGISSIKIRAREYIPISDDEDRQVLGQSTHCYLERKERTGTVRQKYRLRIPKEDLGPIVEHMLDLPEDTKILRDEIRSHVLVPAVISMYERRVWGGDRDLRVTFDERIRYYKPPNRLYDSYTAMTPAALGTPSAVGPKRILEVKHASQAPLPPWLADLVAELPEATGFSKFLDGMARIAKGGRSLPSLTRPVYKLP